MQFPTTSQKVFVLEANTTGMNTVENQQFFFNLEKQPEA